MPGYTRCITPELLNNRHNHIRFTKTVIPMNVYPLLHGVSFYPLLLSLPPHAYPIHHNMQHTNSGVASIGWPTHACKTTIIGGVASTG